MKDREPLEAIDDRVAIGSPSGHTSGTPTPIHDPMRQSRRPEETAFVYTRPGQTPLWHWWETRNHPDPPIVRVLKMPGRKVVLYMATG